MREDELPTARRWPDWLHRNVLGFGVASFFSDFGHEIVTALLPGFLLSIGAPPIALGVIEAVSNAVQSSAKLISGRLTGRVRRAFPWLVVGYLLTAAKALVGLAYNWPTVVLVRTVGWVGRGARGPMRDYLISRSVDRSAYGRAYGFREALDTLGALLGPVVAFLLLQRLGYRTLMLWTAVPGLLAVAAIMILVRDLPRAPVPQARSDADLGAVFRVFGRRLRAFLVFSIAYVAPTFFILRATQILHAHMNLLGSSAAAVGLYAVHNLVYAASAYPIGRLSDRIGVWRVLRAGYALFGLALMLFALAGTVPILLPLGFVLSGAGTAAVESLQSTAVALTLPEQARAGGLGLQAGLSGFGNLVANVVAGKSVV